MSVFEVTYTADWDGNWVTVVAEVSTPIGGGLQSSTVLDPARAITAARVRTLLLAEGFVPEDPYDTVEVGRFPVKKIV